MLYWNRNKLKEVKVKKRYITYIDPINFVKKYSFVSFAMVDMNCQLKVVLVVGNGVTWGNNPAQA